MRFRGTAKVNRAAVSPAPRVAAALGYSTRGQMAGPNMVGQYYSYQEGAARNAAMSVPAISRGRDLMCSVIGCMSLRMYNELWNGERMERVYVPPRSWLRRLDPTIPNSTLLAWLADDLLFYGRAMLYVSSRTADSLPASFSRLPMGSITTPDQSGPVFFAPSKEVYFQGGLINPDDLVQFISGIQGLVYSSTQCVDIALKLEAARGRNASSSIPAGVLRQTGGEPLSSSELADLAASFNAARATNQTAALNEFLTYTETSALPDKMLLIDASEHQAKDCARLTNTPPYLLGIDSGSYAYQSSTQSRADLYLFGVKPYADCIAETLSGNNVVPRGTFIDFDTEAYLMDNYAVDTMEVADPVTIERESTVDA